MSYEVLARKWRPQQFDEVVGQAHVTDALKNAITSGRIAHAYIFVGPRGVGKTTIARIMAKALNCAKGPTGTPCGECNSCREITEGNNLDVLEIDGASNNTVDQVRELRDNVRYAPSRGPFKIYIIDEVHMLSTSAFNALLKTLEEPPDHVKFVFATTEPHKVITTILSRCQRFDLRRITTRDIVGQLNKIAAAEGVEIHEDAVLAIARGAEGGLRDAESALDQLIAFRGLKITEGDVLSVFGLVARKSLEDLAGAMVRGDVPGLLSVVADLDAAGKDLQRLSSELLDFFRNLLVIAYAGDMSADHDLPEPQAASLKAIAAGIAPGRIAGMVDHLIDLQGQIRTALSRRTVLELFLIRCARAATAVSIDDLLKKVNELKAAAGIAPAAPPASASAARPATPAQAGRPAPVAYSERRAIPAGPVEEGGTELERLTRNWHSFVERVGQLAMLAKSCLLDAKPVEMSHDKLVIGFDPEFASKRDALDLPRNNKAIQAVIEEMFKHPVAVSYTVLSANDAKHLPADRQPVSQASGGKGAGPSTPVESRDKKSRKEWIQEPAVKRALESFNGDIIDIRE
ncbi:MAG: DNA polymerase III subunit gamma/tau [bacterium]